MKFWEGKKIENDDGRVVRRGKRFYYLKKREVLKLKKRKKEIFIFLFENLV